MSETNKNHIPMDPFQDGQARMGYAGSIQLLTRAFLLLPNNDESNDLRESILQAIDDWCEMTGWGYNIVLNRIDLMPPQIGEPNSIEEMH